MTSNEQRRAQWHQVRTAKSRTATDVAWHAKAAKLPKLSGPVRVTVTWWAPNAHRRDPDSLGPWTKAALDALVAIGVLADDSARYVLSVTQQIRVDRDNPRITITLEPEES
jgi:crossover junction endodeoxyribonuclease RusA